MHKKQKIIISAAAGCVVVGLIGFTLFSGLFRKEEALPAMAVPVIISLPVNGSISKVLYYSGNLLPASTVVITSKVSGRIEEVFVKAGDFVSRDQVLVRIEDEIVRFQKDQAFSLWKAADAQFARAKKGLREEEIENTRALVNQAEQDIKLAEENLVRMQRLFENGAIARTQYDEAENAVKTASTKLENAKRSLKLMEQGASDEEIQIAMANADAARAQYEMARLQADNTQVQAPELGLVASLLVDEGNMIGTSTPIAAIVRINPILARIPVPELHYGVLRNGSAKIKVKVFPAAFPGAPGYFGQITALAPVIDAASRTFNVEIEILNPEYVLRPGMYVNVELTLETLSNVLLVPRTTLTTRDGREVVFVLQGEEAPTCRQVEVTTGLRDDEHVQITGGLSPGDRIIVEGNMFLENGQAVQVTGER